MELNQQCLALNANRLTSVSLTVLHLNEMGRGSVGMKQCYEQLLWKTILLMFVKSNNCCRTLREMWFTYLFYIWFCLVHLGKARESLWQCLVLNANGLKSIIFIGSALHNNGVVDQWRWNISAFTFCIGCCLCFACCDLSWLSCYSWEKCINVLWSFLCRSWDLC